MSFSILVNDPKAKAPAEYIWTLKQEQPMPSIRPWYLMADGNELEFIRNHFDNVPISKGAKCCIWKNEMANFILDNLVHLTSS